MTPIETVVLAGSIATIAWIHWYFSVAGREAVRVVADADGVQDVRVRVDGGYTPSKVEVAAGRTVRLRFERVDTSSCSDEVVLPELGIRRFLPVGAVTAIEFNPAHPGTYAFTCGMGMLRGRIVVTRA